LEIVRRLGPSVFRNIKDRRQSPLNATVIVDSTPRAVKKARRQQEFACRCTLIDRKTHEVHGWEKTRKIRLSGMDPVVHN
jgi:hypothetical protein